MSPMVRLPMRMEYALLGFFRAGPSYPYAVHQQLSAIAVYRLVWRLKQRQTYALLERLRDEGLLQADLAVQTGRPARQMLQLTDAGQAAYVNWLTIPVEHGRDFRQEFMTKLFWAVREGAAPCDRLIMLQTAMLRTRLAALRDQSAVSADAQLDQLVFRYREGQLQATLAWLQECRATLGAP